MKMLNKNSTTSKDIIATIIMLLAKVLEFDPVTIKNLFPGGCQFGDLLWDRYHQYYNFDSLSLIDTMEHWNFFLSNHSQLIREHALRSNSSPISTDDDPLCSRSDTANIVNSNGHALFDMGSAIQEYKNNYKGMSTNERENELANITMRIIMDYKISHNNMRCIVDSVEQIFMDARQKPQMEGQK